MKSSIFAVVLMVAGVSQLTYAAPERFAGVFEESKTVLKSMPDAGNWCPHRILFGLSQDNILTVDKKQTAKCIPPLNDNSHRTYWVREIPTTTNTAFVGVCREEPSFHIKLIFSRIGKKAFLTEEGEELLTRASGLIQTVMEK